MALRTVSGDGDTATPSETSARLRPAQRILSATDAIERMTAKREGKRGCYAMFSSYLGGVVTDPALMTVPLDDHMVHRGHGVFDTCSLVNGRLYRLGIHIDRLLASATGARLEVPWSRDELIQMVADTAASSGARNGIVRYWLTAGPGGFSFMPAECEEPCFYCVVLDPMSFGAGGFDPMRDGFRETTVRDTPMKPPLLAQIKSNNYLLNVLTHLEAADGGGTFGIIVDDDGYIAEACVLNVCSISHAGVLVTPPFEGILHGTTMRRLLDLARSTLVPEGLLTGVEQRRLRADETRTGVELIMSGGDTHVFPVVEWDGAPIGDGEVGPVATRLHELIEAETAAGSGSPDDFIDVSYPR
ncbi:aminotransferase class IV [Candidatus Poriferisodalis sp.]|uniref:aminotransferase class IV n=1 Tax=Candidatus Poriferisodalis sp. TaxID=3101277 RepID=UPI003B01D33C